MARKYSEQVRDLCGALKYEGIAVPEIVRRLNEDEAGLGFTVEIKERRVYEYVNDYEAIHGPPPDPEHPDQTSDSIAILKRRSVALTAREITALEKKRPGTLTLDQSRTLRQHFINLDDWEKRAEDAAKRRSRSAREGKGNGNRPGKGPEESEFTRKARERAEQKRQAAPDPIRSGETPSHQDSSRETESAQRHAQTSSNEAGSEDRLTPASLPPQPPPMPGPHQLQQAQSSSP